jgi:membrane-associated phospholipid phosphatase
LLWVDQPVAAWMKGVREGTGAVSLGGDVRRELEAVQQFGQLGFSLLIAWAIVLLDRERCRRLLDWLWATLVAAAILYPAKMLIGRPRPKFDDPLGFAGPFGAYPVEGGVLPGWALGQGSINDIWAMPSGHTVHAVVCGVFLLVVYPRLRPLAVTLVGIVMVARLVLGAHYPSDVTAGAAVGFAVAVPMVRRFGGVRGLDWVWRRVVDRGAEPAFPALARKFGLGGR